MEIRLIPITETLTQLIGDSIKYIETSKKAELLQQDEQLKNLIPSLVELILITKYLIRYLLYQKFMDTNIMQVLM